MIFFIHNGELGSLAYLRPNYARAVVNGRPCFHISLVCDISPNCDCHGEKLGLGTREYELIKM